MTSFVQLGYSALVGLGVKFNFGFTTLAADMQYLGHDTGISSTIISRYDHLQTARKRGQDH